MTLLSVFEAWRDLSFEKALGFSLTIIALLTISKIFPKSESETKSENTTKIIKLIIATLILLVLILADYGNYSTLFFQVFTEPVVNVLITLTT